MRSLPFRIAVLVLLFSLAGLGQWKLLAHLGDAAEAPPTPLKQPLAALPLELESWSGVDREIEDEIRIGDDHLSREYVHGPRGQRLKLWMVYSKTGQDRNHHPEVCFAVAGQPEDMNFRQPIPIDGDAHPVQQYRFGRTGNAQWVFYWHYTLPTVSDGRELSSAQEVYRRLRQRTGSVTIEVFAPEMSPSDLEGAREFVRLVDAAIRRAIVPEGSVRGSDRIPVKVVPGT